MRDRLRIATDENNRITKEIQKIGLQNGRIREKYAQAEEELKMSQTRADLLQERNDALEVAQVRLKKAQRR